MLPGTLLGGFERPVPSQLLFPDFFGSRRAAGKPAASDFRSFDLSTPHHIMREDVADSLSDYWRQASRASGR